MSCPRNAPASTVLLGGAEVRGNGTLASWAAPCASGPSAQGAPPAAGIAIHTLTVTAQRLGLVSRNSSGEGGARGDVREPRPRAAGRHGESRVLEAHGTRAAARSTGKVRGGREGASRREGGQGGLLRGRGGPGVPDEGSHRYKLPCRGAAPPARWVSPRVWPQPVPQQPSVSWK